MGNALEAVVKAPNPMRMAGLMSDSAPQWTLDL